MLEDGIIWLCNVSVGYGEIEVLYGVSFDIIYGGCIVIIGCFGVGKLMLFFVFSGILFFKSGEVYVSGFDVLIVVLGVIRSISVLVN